MEENQESVNQSQDLSAQPAESPRPALAPGHHKNCSAWTVKTGGQPKTCDCRTADLTLTPEQIKNWRRAMVGVLGGYALIMPAEEIQKLRDKMQERATDEQRDYQACFTDTNVGDD